MRPLVLVFVAAIACSCSRAATPPPPREASPDPMLQKLQTMTARFAPVDLSADLSKMPDSEKRALAKMVEASRVFDALYLRQVWDGNETLLAELAADDTPLGRARLHYFLLNKGPWSRLDHNEAFVDGAPA